MIPDSSEEPSLLLWGVPIPFNDAAGLSVRKRLEAVSDSLHERAESRSEPDVILDFGNAGVVFIEVKLWSGNEVLDFASPKWNRYIEASNAFADPDKAKRSGLYELTRNWRIAFDLAKGRTTTLINLGLESLSEDGQTKLVNFRKSLNTRPDCSFRTVSWRQLVRSISRQPEWLTRYVTDRELFNENRKR